MIIADLEQGSAEWLVMRTGCATGSRVADVVAKLKKGAYAACRNNYLWEVACERLTGLHQNNFVSPAMEWGTAHESEARAEYEMALGVLVDEIGLAVHPKIKHFSASPDGLVGTDGVLEIKCPNTATHLQWRKAGLPPEEYCPQMLAEIACTERKWCDFVSYDPRLPENLRFFCVRFQPEQELINLMEKEVEQFLWEVEELLAEVQVSPALLIQAGELGV